MHSRRITAWTIDISTIIIAKAPLNLTYNSAQYHSPATDYGAMLLLTTAAALRAPAGGGGTKPTGFYWIHSQSQRWRKMYSPLSVLNNAEATCVQSSLWQASTDLPGARLQKIRLQIQHLYITTMQKPIQPSISYGLANKWQTSRGGSSLFSGATKSEKFGANRE